MLPGSGVMEKLFIQAKKKIPGLKLVTGESFAGRFFQKICLLSLRPQNGFRYSGQAGFPPMVKQWRASGGVAWLKLEICEHLAFFLQIAFPW